MNVNVVTGEQVSEALAAELLDLEQRLLRPGVRENSQEAEKLLAPNFREIGKSGRTYDKSQILKSMLNEPLAAIPAIEHFEARPLAPSLVLVTYQCNAAKRSSIWQKSVDQWQIIFHQGTPVTN